MDEHKGLRRLSRVWKNDPVYFITTCLADRDFPILGKPDIAALLITEWKQAKARHGWAVGPYVIMPDHVHFFCRKLNNDVVSLSDFVGRWKQWTAKGIVRQLGLPPGSYWQAEFYDHLIRSEEEFLQRATYIEQNPVRAGLVARYADWPCMGDLDMYSL